MNSRNNLIPKFTSLLAMGASILAAHQSTAAGVVAAGDQFGAAISEEGTLRTWGLNDVGQLGLGTTLTNQPLPTEVSISTVPGEEFALTEAGSNFLFAVSTDGTVYATGSNSEGQLGIGSTTSTNVFKRINNAPNIADVAAGYNYAYAISDDGTLYAWGENGNYELGIGTYNDPNPESLNDSAIERPYKVNFGLWKDVAASKSDSTAFTVGIMDDGTLWAWGSAASLVGAPSGVQITSPVQIGTESDWEEVEVGNLQVIARNSDDEVFTWGAGIALGQGQNTTQSTTPIEVNVNGVSGWSAIGVGFETTFAITDDGRLFGWGNNTQMQIGGTITISGILFTPVEISPGNTFTEVTGGFGSVDFDARDAITLAMGTVGDDDGFYTFGANSNGQAGVGGISFGTSSQPVRTVADGLKIAITNPKVNNLSSNVFIGINTTQPITVTVSNPGEVQIATGYTVSLYLATADSDGLDTDTDLLLDSVTIQTPLAVEDEDPITFEEVSFGALLGGDYILYALVSLEGTATNVNTEGTIGQTNISIREPNIKLSNVDILGGDQLLLPNNFTDVTVQLENASEGVILPNQEITINVYLSDDNELSASDILLTVVPNMNYDAGLGANEVVTLGPSTIEIPVSVTSGQRYLIFIADEDLNLPDSDPEDNTVFKLVSLFRPDRIDLAIDYGYYTNTSDDGGWSSTEDLLASGGLAYLSPALEMGENAIFSTMIQGPTELTVPWRIEGAAADNISIDINGGTFSFAGGSSPIISGYVPTYQTNTIILEENALYTVDWIYSQASDFEASFGLLDIDIPVFRTSGDGIWRGVEYDPNVPNPPPPPPIGDRWVQSPSLAQDESASFDVNVVGPALVSFWVRTSSVVDEDTLTFLIDGDIQNLPTAGFDDETTAAIFSGDNDWFKVAFLVEGGERNLSWLYTKGSDSPDSTVFVDGLSVLRPIPEQSDPNQISEPTEYANIPVYNVDLAVQDVVATPGDYILDGANGSGRLPISIVVGSVGSDFDVSTINANFASNIDVRLSLDTVFGNADDVLLGNFAETQVVNQGDKIVLSADINLPFDTPAGNYNIFVRFMPPPVIQEFSYENNTQLIGPDFVIIRAPDLIAKDMMPPSATYPYHPEDTLLYNYSIFNRGLGPIGLDDAFDVQVRLMAIEIDEGTQADAIEIKTYTPFELSVFLPQVSATYPNGGSTGIQQFIEIPPLRDILAGLGLVPDNEPEDSAEVYANQEELRGYVYYFEITLDSADAILESSESNTFVDTYFDRDINVVRPGFFYIYPTPGLEDYGSFTGQFPFSDDLGLDDPATDLSLADVDTDGDQIMNLLEYALGTNPTEFTPIFNGDLNAPANVMGSYNIQSLIIPPSDVAEEYLTITFDFNVRATDITITLQSGDGMAFDEDLLALTPPYIADYGPQSLTGFNGLKDNPLVMSVAGNVTAVQQIYTARITVRDSQPLATNNDGVLYSSRLMRLLVESNLAAPGAPTGLVAAYNGLTGNVNLTWTPDSPANPNEGGSFQILRSLGQLNDFKAIGSSSTPSFIDNDVSSLTAYTYKVRLVNSAGASGESNTDTVVIP